MLFEVSLFKRKEDPGEALRRSIETTRAPMEIAEKVMEVKVL
jgi:hypothetical protein